MFRRASEKYVTLQDYVPLPEQRAMERAVVTVLPRIEPSQAFVTQLGRDLVEEARRQHVARESTASQTLRILGIFSGGVLSVLGGIVLWLLLHHDEKQAGGGLSLPGTPQRVASPGSL
ncbi:MAG: hypothetical protein ACP5HS_13980 [Anaerolineae bacterium]